MFIEFKNPLKVSQEFWDSLTWISETVACSGQGQVSETSGKIIYHSDIYQVIDNIIETVDNPALADNNIYLSKGDFVIIETTKTFDDDGYEVPNGELITGIGDAMSNIKWLLDEPSFKAWFKEKMTIRLLPDIIDEDIHA